MLWLLVGCSSSTEPGSRIPATGHYTYTSSYGSSGELVLTYAAADSVAGYWNVPGFQQPLALGFWNVDAYVLDATVTGVGLAAHRVAVAGQGMSCSLRVIAGNVSTAYSCSLAYQGP